MAVDSAAVPVAAVGVAEAGAAVACDDADAVAAAVGPQPATGASICSVLGCCKCR